MIQKEYGEFDSVPSPVPTRSLSGPDYMSWLHEKMDEMTPWIQQIGDAVSQRLPASWGKPGEAGDPLQILKATNEIISICQALLTWEHDIRSTAPPPKLKRLG
ncbi:MAG: hypothetical protein ABSH09_26570, partial [Bryobacteraceae bacterium]